MKKIQRTSHMLSILFRALCWLIPLWTAYLVLFNLQGMFNSGSSLSPLIALEKVQNIAQFTIWHRCLILAIQLIPDSISILICYFLAKLFRLYEQGYLFEEENIQLIRNISLAMIAGEILQIIYQPLVTAALTFNNQVGERFISLSVGTANFSTLITACIILTASWIAKEAQQLKTDVQLTI